MLFILICCNLDVLAFFNSLVWEERKKVLYVTFGHILKSCLFLSLADGCFVANQGVLLLLHVRQHLWMITWLLIWMQSCQTLSGPQGQNQVWQETYWKVSFQDISVACAHCLLKARIRHKKRALVYGNRHFLVFWLKSALVISCPRVILR